jgi:hypothetical protein
MIPRIKDLGGSVCLFWIDLFHLERKTKIKIKGTGIQLEDGIQKRSFIEINLISESRAERARESVCYFCIRLGVLGHLKGMMGAVLLSYFYFVGCLFYCYRYCYYSLCESSIEMTAKLRSMYMCSACQLALAVLGMLSAKHIQNHNMQYLVRYCKCSRGGGVNLRMLPFVSWMARRWRIFRTKDCDFTI